jgi:chromosome segregation ATPase
MTAIDLENPTLEKQIAQLESEISDRQRDIERLRDALETVEANKPGPQKPDADDIHALLREMLSSVPKTLEEKQVYEEKLVAARTSLHLATEAYRQKQLELSNLRQEQ